MKKYLLFLFLLCAFTVHAQIVIKGQVVDEKTKESIPGVSIYVNNTTIGTVADSDGKFTINVPFKGTIELVASYVSYEKKITIVENYDGKGLNIYLKQQDNTLNEVVIKSIKGDDYTKWGDLFKKLLLGKDEHFVSGCKIVNPEVLVFYLDKRTNDLTVYAKSSLIVENKITGYKVKIDIDNFNFNFNSEILQLHYSTFFEEMKLSKVNQTSADVWRRTAYYGSQMHFMRAVFNNTTYSNGYKVYLFRSLKNGEKERVAKIIQDQLNSENSQNAINYDLKKLFKVKDTADYYRLVMKQNDILTADTTLTAIRRYTKLDRSLSIMNFSSKDTLMINYQQYLDQNNKSITPGVLAKWQAQNPVARSKGETTVMYFVDSVGANIQDTGYYPENDLYYYGDMFDRRISQLLPWDYDPNL